MEAFGSLTAALSAFGELALIRAFLCPNPVECVCEAPVPEAAVSGECRLLAELVGRPTSCVCQCDCHCVSEAAADWSTIWWVFFLISCTCGAFLAGLLLGGRLRRRSVPVAPSLDPVNPG